MLAFAGVIRHDRSSDLTSLVHGVLGSSPPNREGSSGSIVQSVFSRRLIPSPRFSEALLEVNLLLSYLRKLFLDVLFSFTLNPQIPAFFENGICPKFVYLLKLSWNLIRKELNALISSLFMFDACPS